MRKRAFHLLWEPGYLRNGFRPGAAAPNVMVTSPNQLSAMAGIRILSQGGNAVDAAGAIGLADSIVNPQQHTLGGEATILIYVAKLRRVVAINGNTRAPRQATIELYRERGIENIPWEGLLAAGVPALVDAWITALDRFGTLTLAEVAQPAVELAERGFPVSPSLHAMLYRRRERWLKEWHGSAKVYLPAGQVPPVGALLTNRDLASTLRGLMEVERLALEAGADRSKALKAARALFYRGDIADTIVRFSQANGGLLCKEDMEGFSVAVEEPFSVNYRGYQVYKAGPWCQGPVLLQALNLLEGYNLGSMAPEDSQLIHTVVEAEKLAFADREQYYGDPRFVDVPMEQLLSKEYAAKRRSLMDPNRASLSLRPGDPYRLEPELKSEGKPGSFRLGAPAPEAKRGDTVHFDVVDSVGNMVSATSSGGVILHSPLVDGLGFALGTRLQMFYLDPHHPNGLAPGKQPRTTVSPTLVLRDDRPFATLGSPGGDSQEQATLQALIRLIDFQMPVQEAVERPLFMTRHFPSSFTPHPSLPGSLHMEARMGPWVELQLRRKGHRVSMQDWVDSGLLAIQIDQQSGVRTAGVDPRPAILNKWEVASIGY